MVNKFLKRFRELFSNFKSLDQPYTIKNKSKLNHRLSSSLVKDQVVAKMYLLSFHHDLTQMNIKLHIPTNHELRGELQ